MRAQAFLYMTFLSVLPIYSAPIVQSIANNSPVGFLIIQHSDSSSCSLHRAGKVIDAYSVFQHDFLIEPAVEPGKPSLTLRAIYWYDDKTNQKYFLVDQDNNYDKDAIQRAYFVWSQSNYKKRFLQARKIVDAESWFNYWVGKDILICPHTVEMFGYVLHRSCIEINNSIRKVLQWLCFSQSCFSRLVIDIEIDVHKNKGILPFLKVSVGEGGICKQGVVERI